VPANDAGTVTHDADDGDGEAHRGDLIDGQLDRENAAILATPVRLAAHPAELRLARAQVAIVFFVQWRRHQQAQALPEHLRLRVAKHALCRRR
jgi:hypothetical protein